MKYLLLTAFTAGCLVCTAQVNAKPLVISPYPNVKGGGMPESTAAPVVAPEAVQRPVLRFRVPQPGDAYFDTPSSVEASPEPAPLELVAEQEVDVVPESFEAAVPVREEALVVRMSDGLEGIQVIEPTHSQKARMMEPVAAPVLREEEAERVNWFASRAPLKTSIPTSSAAPRAVAAQWKVLEGENVRNILERWTQQEGVELIWNNQNAFAVLEPFEMNGSFEQAVKGLLDQYQSNQVRPVAKLHVDPETLERTLVVQVKVNS